MAKGRSGQKRRASTAKAKAKASPSAPPSKAPDPGSKGAGKPAPAPAPAPAAAPAARSGTGAATATAAPPRRPAAARATPPRRPAPSRADAPLEGVAGRLGIPPVALLLGTSAWLLMIVLWAAHAVGGGFAVFFAAVLTAAVGVGSLIARIAREASLLETLQAGVVLVLAGTIPIVFDPHTADVFNLPRYSLVVIGALVLAGLAAIAVAHERRAPTWRVGVQWPIAAVVLWTIISALASKDVNVSLLGNYGSYDGLYAALAFATIAMATAGSIRPAHVRKALGALAFCGGGVVVLYGLIQLHDTELGGHLWDFVHWHDTSFSNQIFSTFGNPNHLAGYLAIVLPAIVVVGLQARRRWWQVAAVVLGLAALLEILRSAARGAWVAVIVSALVLLVAVAPELRRRPALSFGTLGGLLAVVVAGMAAFGHRLLHVPLSSLFQSSSTSPVGQRFQIWHQAVHMAANHPITGIGPDLVALVYPQYQTAAWVKGLGPDYVVNGAHDIFMNVLADQGFVGLVLFLALLAVLALRSVGAWRRLRARERAGADGLDAGDARGERLLLAAVAAGITAYIVQAAFNVQQMGLSFCFWLLVGLLAVVTGAAGVPDSLRPSVLLRPTAPDEPIDAASAPTAAPAPPRRRARRPPARRITWVTALTAAAATALVVVLSLGADGPWRADHAFWGASMAAQASTQAAKAGSAGVQQAAQDSSAYVADMNEATVLNPWEPRYPATEASTFAGDAAHVAPSNVVRELTAAKRLYAQAMADEPLIGTYAYNAASVDVQLARASKAQRRSAIADAVTAARTAVADNPLNAAYQKLLKAVEADQRTGTTNG